MRHSLMDSSNPLKTNNQRMKNRNLGTPTPAQTPVPHPSAAFSRKGGTATNYPPAFLTTDNCLYHSSNPTRPSRPRTECFLKFSSRFG